MKKIAWIRSHHLHLQWKFKLLARKFTWGNKAKHCWVMSTIVFKSLLTMPSNGLPLLLKHTFPPIIWIFTEGDGIESRLPFKIFSTLRENKCFDLQPLNIIQDICHFEKHLFIYFLRNYYSFFPPLKPEIIYFLLKTLLQKYTVIINRNCANFSW